MTLETRSQFTEMFQEPFNVVGNHYSEYKIKYDGWYLIDNTTDKTIRITTKKGNESSSTGITQYFNLYSKGKCIIRMDAGNSLRMLLEGGSSDYVKIAYFANHKPQFSEFKLESDMEIGAVEIKDATTTNRALVTSSGKLSVTDDNLITTASNTAINIANTSTMILSANSSRRYAIIVNNSDTVVYLALGAAASVNSGIRLNANGGAYEITNANLFKGAIYGIHNAGEVNKVVTVVEGV